ncbi:Chloroperoxidase [Phytophthora cactorum]|nr:Chloroperoxidase [Phytophthora cactorum]
MRVQRKNFRHAAVAAKLASDHVLPHMLRPQRASCTSLNCCSDHHYFRPSGADVSGFPPPNSAPNHRSPCPALNSLANHGYLPRDGKALTPQMIREAVMDVYNLSHKRRRTGSPRCVLIAMGDYESKTVSVDHAKSFLVEEKIPDDFQRSDKPISTAAAFYLAAQIKLLASLGWGTAVE